MLSHELRNPLAAILSATRVLESARWGDDACSEAGRSSRARPTTWRGCSTICSMSRGSRAAASCCATERVDLRDTSRSAIEALGPFLAEHGTRLEVDIADEPISVVGDPARLQQIQANLLSNASKYSPRGAQVRFEVRREDGAGDDSRQRRRATASSREMLPRIFDLFVQGDQSLERSEGGLGHRPDAAAIARGAARRPRRGAQRRPRPRQRLHRLAAAGAEAAARSRRPSAGARRRCAPWSSSKIRRTRGG